MRETICLIAGGKNEGKSLPAFFKYHEWVDEILLMDSFSTDNTEEICREYNRQCFKAEMGGDANKRHNLALKTAKSDWVFLIDPDEFISDELKNEIFEILDKGTDCAAFENKRVNFFLDKPLRYGGWSGYSMKFFRKNSVSFNGDSFHEKPIIDGKIGRLKGEVRHYPSPNIHWILQKFNYISEFDLKEYANKHGELAEKQFKWLLISKPFKNFWKCYIRKKGYKDGLHGFIYAMLMWAFDVIRICKYGERYLIKNPNIPALNELPDPWECRKKA
ncbi:MAG: glycosyltransferase family 2 protein [Candidatus Omnitrophota bacterium]